MILNLSSSALIICREISVFCLTVGPVNASSVWGKQNEVIFYRTATQFMVVGRISIVVDL